MADWLSEPIGLMVLISAMNGPELWAGMAIGATVALPELLKGNYDKRMVTGVIQEAPPWHPCAPCGRPGALWRLIAPRQPWGQLWLA